MIFAAGLGTRLKPFTDNHPKALFPVCGKPLLEHVINKLKASGFDEIIINVHHFAEQIIDFLNKNNFNIRIEISNEQSLLLDTGGGIKRAASFFDDGKPFLVHNVDILSNADLTGFYNYHIKQKDAIASLLVNDRTTSRYLLWDKLNKLVGWTNIQTEEIKSPYSNLDLSVCKKMAFSGIHVISPSIFTYMNKWPEKFSIIDFYLSIANKESIYGFMPKELKLVDVGKPENLLAAESLIADNVGKNHYKAI